MACMLIHSNSKRGGEHHSVLSKKVFCFLNSQTIVELAETGSLDLSIFCSTCLVIFIFSSFSFPPPDRISHRRGCWVWERVLLPQTPHASCSLECLPGVCLCLVADPDCTQSPAHICSHSLLFFKMQNLLLFKIESLSTAFKS